MNPLTYATLGKSMKKYLQELSLNFQSHLIYPARFVIWFFVDTLQVFFMPFLWLSIYAERTDIGGFSRADIVTYYVLVLLVGVMSKSHVARRVQFDIMNGDLNGILLKPVHYLILRPMREVSYKLILFITTIPLVALGAFLFPTYTTLPTQPVSWLYLSLGCVIAYLISLPMQLCIGLTAVWIGETKSVDAFKNIAQYVLSGELAPLAFLPTALQRITAIAPFQYIISFPVELFLERLSPIAIAQQFFFASCWMIVLWLLVVFMWKRVVSTYEGVGI